MPPTVKLIYAHSQNLVIGYRGDMPWGRNLPEDLAHFKALTLGQTVLMGRKTWESLPPHFRPLPQRRNIVLSRDAAYSAPGAEVFADLETALDTIGTDSTHCIWVIGGAQIYQLALPLATEIWVTQIDAAFEGDAYAPVLDEAQWLAHPQDWQRSVSGLSYRFVHHQRRYPIPSP